MITDPLEIAATALTLICVVLAVKRSLWQFPTGILGTGLGFFVFWKSGLISSAILQPVFIAVQVYGWWFWMRGDQSKAPPIRTTPITILAGLCVLALVIAAAGASTLETYAGAQMALPDAIILSLSILAQILLSLKRIENWPVWIVINVISVWVYASQALWLYAALYTVLFFNAFWGWWEWRKELRSYSPAQTSTQAAP